MSEKKPQANVSEKKKKTVQELVNLAKHKTILLASIKNLPCSQFQEIKKKLIGKAEVKVPKKHLIQLALEKSKLPGIEQLQPYLQESYAVLFSDEDAFELSGFLSENKTSSKAKEGQISDQDITLEPGATELPPGPDISALSSLGIKVKVEGGKIAIQEAKLFIKVGETVTSQKAAVLSKLGITPFKIGFEPTVAYSDGKLYTNIKINKQETIDSFKHDYARSIAFAVSIAYPTKETIGMLLGKAGLQEKAISSLIKTENQTN